MLVHRSGTLYEDMYWIDIDKLKVITSETMQTMERKILYSKNTRKLIAENKNLLPRW